MTTYKIVIDSRTYDTWNIVDTSTMERVSIDGVCPIKHKLFTNDTFTYDAKSDSVVVKHSGITGDIPATLVLDNSKTYGRRNGKLVYKCVPDDCRIPVFLVPYEMKHLGFSKALVNLFVLVKLDKWTDKHPHGTLTQTIGTVDALDNFYEYQLYCKSLNASIQRFNRATMGALAPFKNTNCTYIDYESIIDAVCAANSKIEDRTGEHIFSIDPATSTDFDDAFHFKPNVETGGAHIGIYIANVAMLIDALGLWSSFSKRISTIYLPDRKRPMLPTILSDQLCSLQANRRRFAFAMDVFVDANGCVEHIAFSNCVIRVKTNYAYESSVLLNFDGYSQLLMCVRKMSAKTTMSVVKDSHDLVCYLMIFMNHWCAKDLLTFKTGIFRSTIVKANTLVLPEGLPDGVQTFIKMWSSASSQYVDIRKSNVIRHDMLELDAYTHITSPIRRLVDLLNIIKFQQNHELAVFSVDASAFYEQWISELDYINITMRSIRKIQNDCALLHICTKNESVLQKTYEGFCFDKLPRDDGLFQYNVYIPSLKMASKIVVRDDMANFSENIYRLFVFKSEDRLKRKIRLQLISPA